MSLGKPRRTLVSVDEGVSPVVGMILVLAISIVGISAIMYWGLPAIDEMKANVEHRSIETQFTELDSSIKELVAGTTEKAAKRWQPSMSRGSVIISENVEAWLYATESYDAANNYDFIWYGFGQTTLGHDFYLGVQQAATPASGLNIDVYRVGGTASVDQLIIDDGVNSVAEVTSFTLAAGAADQFFVYETDLTPVDFSDGTYLFQIKNNAGDVLAQAWYVRTGRVDYALSAGIGSKAVIENNGAVISGTNGEYLITNTPPIPPQTTPAGGVPRFFGRVISLTGEGSFAGEDRFDILMSLYSTKTLASRDCAQVDAEQCAESSKIFVYGTYQAPWYSYLTNAGRNYDFDEIPFTATGGDGIGTSVDYIGYREPAGMGYTLLQSTISLSTSG